MQISLSGISLYDVGGKMMGACPSCAVDHPTLEVTKDNGVLRGFCSACGFTLTEAMKEVQDEAPSVQEAKTEEVKIPSFLMPSSSILEMILGVEWVVDGLIPKGAITLFFGRGGVGKTWVSLQVAKAVAEGSEVWGLKTVQMSTVFIDMENPLPMLRERLEKVGTAPNFWVWHISAEKRPPLLNKADWGLYQKLPAGSLIVYDTLRAAHTGDENSSQDMSLVMNRLKVLREQGFTVLLLHHTRKGDEGIYKGSTAISDLCDHQICLESLRGDDDLDLEKGTFRLGTKDKSRFIPSEIHLTFSGDGGGFVLGEDPAKARCEDLRSLLEEMPDDERFTTKIIDKANEEYGWSHHKTRSVLKKGQGTYWNTLSEGKGKKTLYIPL